MAWRAYKIGPGKFVRWETLDIQPNAEVPLLSEVEHGSYGEKPNFKTIRSKKPKSPSKQANTADPSDSVSSDESSAEESNCGLFSCPEEGCIQLCIKRYQRHSSLQRHLDCGKHHRVIEKERLLDSAIAGYSERLDVQSGDVPNIPTEVNKLQAAGGQLGGGGGGGGAAGGQLPPPPPPPPHVLGIKVVPSQKNQIYR